MSDKFCCVFSRVFDSFRQRRQLVHGNVGHKPLVLCVVVLGR